MMVFTLLVAPYLEDNGTKPPANPANRAELLRIITFLINQVRLIEDLLRFRQAYPVPLLYQSVFSRVEFETH